MAEGTTLTDHGGARPSLLMDESFAWFVASMVAILVYFMCAMVDAPLWAFVWLLAIPLLYAWRLIIHG